MYAIKSDESTPKVMNCLSQEKDTLSDFRNLLQSTYQSLPGSKIVVSMQTRSVSKPFKSVCLECESHAAATRGCFSTCLVPEAEQLCQLNGALI